MNESKFRITYTYTTNRISGTVYGPAEYFDNEKDALARYTALRHNDGNIDGSDYGKQLSRSSVTLWKNKGWEVVIGSNERSTA